MDKTIRYELVFYYILINFRFIISQTQKVMPQKNTQINIK